MLYLRLSFLTVLALAVGNESQAGYVVRWDNANAGARFSASGGGNYEWGLLPMPLADFDGDGRKELVVGITEGSGTRIRVSDALSAQVEFETLLSWQSELGIYFAPVDLDGDGIPEIIGFTWPGSLGMVVITYIGSAGAGEPQMQQPQAPGATLRPNPFNPTAMIDYSLAIKGNVTLRAYDTAGRLVRTLVDGPVVPGSYSIPWDGRDNAGHVLPSGTYLYSLSLDGQVLDKGKAVILK